MSEVPINAWPGEIRERYENYLKTSFFFADANLRGSFQNALRKEGELLSKPYEERGRGFQTAGTAGDLAQMEGCFPDQSGDLQPALLEHPLYTHQEQAVRKAYIERKNIVVATGTASGKTESFLYPILFELYHQHCSGKLAEHPGVRAMILYPMNALANDQRERLGKICKDLNAAGSGFSPTFGQYTGQTPEGPGDNRRNGREKGKNRLTNELVFREEMRASPPHILLTNYSMLEFLLIRPDDSPLFDSGRGKYWQFIVLDEAHQYRGTKGMEMGMLIRRLKQRLRDGGREGKFSCIATSATISSGESEDAGEQVAQFSNALFGEEFDASSVIFSKPDPNSSSTVRRHHAFLRALEGAFLIRKDGKDEIILNRSSGDGDAKPIEIALCGECGQHYYVGREQNGILQEAIRDPSHNSFGVDFYLPLAGEDVHSGINTVFLCKHCGSLSGSDNACGCSASVPVMKCENHRDHPDQLSKCETCNYNRGGIGDPVREIVHGSVGPNSVIATALHSLLPEGKRKVLAFADSRQQAAYFAWYAQDSYEKLRDRNLMLRAINTERTAEGLSIEDLKYRLLRQMERAGSFFNETDSPETKSRKALTLILREAITDEKRLSLSGVGLIAWSVKIPEYVRFQEIMEKPPWNLDSDEARCLMKYMLNEMLHRCALYLPDESVWPPWTEISPRRQQKAFGLGSPGGRQRVQQWDSNQLAIVRHYLFRLLAESDLPNDDKKVLSVKLMQDIFHAMQKDNDDLDSLLLYAKRSGGAFQRIDGVFQLNPGLMRIDIANPDSTWECKTCATLTMYNIRSVCPRNRCPGTLAKADQRRLAQNHYRILYEMADLPPTLESAEHTAQIDTDTARKRQEQFKENKIHLLSSSTTFEVGVDLGDLDVVFLRNVPPEPFNYTQRVGRAGRRAGSPGLALTYCNRNPHDLYHYKDPKRIIEGAVVPPRLQMTNQKIIRRHMVATALSFFFREPGNRERFDNVASFIGDWKSPKSVRDVMEFCRTSSSLEESIKQIVPANMHGRMNLNDDGWIEYLAGRESRLGRVEAEVCGDHEKLADWEQRMLAERNYPALSGIEKRYKSIEKEDVLKFLSRKAVIPKYGFPVDVVELETRSSEVELQRDLSQAIAEYAPGCKVIANKQEWESCGIKVVRDRECRVRHYRYDAQHNFNQIKEEEYPDKPEFKDKYIVPEFGFVAPMASKSQSPHGGTKRLYTTRPFFRGFEKSSGNHSPSALIRNVQISKATPGVLVVLCEGRHRARFYICRTCGTHTTNRRHEHNSPMGRTCSGTLEKFSLGHELETDVVRLQFLGLRNIWDAYSVGYALLLGAAEVIGIPNTDLNVTVTGGKETGETAIVLYDDVPGGAGLVAQLDDERTFSNILDKSQERVSGNCGCDFSCYGCLRSYRNQFAHTHLSRTNAQEILQRTAV